MLAFSTSLDIANRALQHCGKERLFSLDDAVPGAREIAFAYDKLRRAELRRNVWRFATARAILRPLDFNTYSLVPVTWDTTVSYVLGSIVKRTGLTYISRISSNLGRTPELDQDAWALYFGSNTVSEFPATAGSFWAGELVYTPQGDDHEVYLSLTSRNSDTPGVYPSWSTTTLYNTGDTVISPAAYTVEYSPDNLGVYFSTLSLPVGGVANFWQSAIDMNVANTPAIGSSHWVPIPVPLQENQRFGQNWLQLDAAVSAIVNPYPLTAGPLAQSGTKNAFLLPNGYLRRAPEQTKGSISGPVGYPGTLPQDDWDWEGNFIVSGTANPIMLRFVADIADVRVMDDMFCEGLACRIAREIVPMLAASDERSARIKEIEGLYKEIMGEARLVNGIETGPVSARTDDWITCRY